MLRYLCDALMFANCTVLS